MDCNWARLGSAAGSILVAAAAVVPDEISTLGLSAPQRCFSSNFGGYGSNRSSQVIVPHRIPFPNGTDLARFKPRGTMNRVFKITVYTVGILSTLAVGVKEVSRSAKHPVPTSAEEARKLNSDRTSLSTSNPHR